jgi:ketosteroid isomerase-like protein
MKKSAASHFVFVFSLALFASVIAGGVGAVVAEPSRAKAQEPVPVAEPAARSVSKAKTQAPVAVAEPTAQNVSQIEKQIKDLENQWNEAMLHHDVATMNRILAQDVIDTGGDGHVQGKAEDLADLKSGEPNLQSSSVDDMKVRVYGNAAVVNGHFVQKGTYKGKDISGEGRFTDVFVKRQGRWECVSTQGTPLLKQ